MLFLRIAQSNPLALRLWLLHDALLPRPDRALNRLCMDRFPTQGRGAARALLPDVLLPDLHDLFRQLRDQRLAWGCGPAGPYRTDAAALAAVPPGNGTLSRD